MPDGQVDAFLKMPRPDDEASGLGTTRLDEPTLSGKPRGDAFGNWDVFSIRMMMMMMMMVVMMMVVMTITMICLFVMK